MINGIKSCECALICRLVQVKLEKSEKDQWMVLMSLPYPGGNAIVVENVSAGGK